MNFLIAKEEITNILENIVTQIKVNMRFTPEQI